MTELTFKRNSWSTTSWLWQWVVDFETDLVDSFWEFLRTLIVSGVKDVVDIIVLRTLSCGKFVVACCLYHVCCCYLDPCSQELRAVIHVSMLFVVCGSYL